MEVLNLNYITLRPEVTSHYTSHHFPSPHTTSFFKIIMKNFINKFSYKLTRKFTEYDLLVIKVIIIIIIIKKPIYNLFQLKKKERLFSNTISVGDYFQAKCSCEEIDKKKQMG